MAETSKRPTNNSASKSRKSKNDIIRTTLGTYLKQKNYSMNEKFRKSDLTLTQTLDQYDVSMMMDDDLAKMNSILYSNVLCLSNNQPTVELQFSKFVKFVQTQTVPEVKSELQTLLWPLMCHIYIEMIKGKDSRPAAEFLRKYASLIGPVENANSPVANELNGQSQDNQMSQQPEQQTDTQRKESTLGPAQPSSTTQIIFVSSDGKSSKISSSPNKSDKEHNSNDISDYFKELVQSLSLCLRIDEIETIEIANNFRSAKYEMVLSLQSSYALKHFFAKFGHVIILHIVQTWFSLDIREFLNESENEDDDDMDIDQNERTKHNFAEKNGTETDGDDFDFQDSTYQLHNTNKEIKSLICKVESEIKTVNGLGTSMRVDPTNKTDLFPTPSLADCLPTVMPNRQSFTVVQNKYLQNVRARVIRSRKMDLPTRVFNLINVDYRLSSCDIDKNDCHLVCGFNDSTIKLWQLNQSKMRGRKPFRPFSNRLCEWSLDNCDSSSSSDSNSDSEEYDSLQPKRFPITGQFFQRRTPLKPSYLAKITGTIPRNKREQKLEFMERRCEDNIFGDGGCITLRGHNSGVTDVLFSKYNPLMYSVSKDKTIRAWKACDYRCGAVYIGHNHPIWCITESSTGLYMATGSHDMSARLWSTDRNHSLQKYIGHTQDVDAIAFHPNGNYIATGSSDLTVRLWDVTSGKLLRVFIDCHLPVHCVSFSLDGKYLAAGGEEPSVRIFDLAAGSQINEFKDHSANVNSIVWNSNSTKLATCCADGTIRVFAVNKSAQDSHSPVASPSSATASTSSTSTPTSTSTSTSSTSTSSTSTSATSSPNSNNNLLISKDTGCKRAIKVFFSFNDTVTCIGNS